MASPRYNPQALIKEACMHARRPDSEEAKDFFTKHSPNITDGVNSPLQQLLAEDKDDKMACNFINTYGAVFPMSLSFTSDPLSRGISPYAISLYTLIKSQNMDFFTNKEESILKEHKTFIKYRDNKVNITDLLDYVYSQEKKNRENHEYNPKFHAALMGAAIAGNEDVLNIVNLTTSYNPINYVVYALGFSGQTDLVYKAYNKLMRRKEDSLNFKKLAFHYLIYGVMAGRHHNLFQVIQKNLILNRRETKDSIKEMISAYSSFIHRKFPLAANMFDLRFSNFKEFKSMDTNILQTYLDASLSTEMAKLLIWFQKNVSFFPMELNRIILEYLIGLPYQMVKDTIIKRQNLLTQIATFKEKHYFRYYLSNIETLKVALEKATTSKEICDVEKKLNQSSKGEIYLASCKNSRDESKSMLMHHLFSDKTLPSIYSEITKMAARLDDEKVAQSEEKSELTYEKIMTFFPQISPQSEEEIQIFNQTLNMADDEKAYPDLIMSIKNAFLLVNYEKIVCAAFLGLYCSGKMEMANKFKEMFLTQISPEKVVEWELKLQCFQAFGLACDSQPSDLKTLESSFTPDISIQKEQAIMRVQQNPHADIDDFKSTLENRRAVLYYALLGAIFAKKTENIKYLLSLSYNPTATTSPKLFDEKFLKKFVDPLVQNRLSLETQRVSKKR